MILNRNPVAMLSNFGPGVLANFGPPAVLGPSAASVRKFTVGGQSARRAPTGGHHTIRSKSYAKARRHKPPRPIALTKRSVAVEVGSPYDEYSRSSDSRPLGRRQRSDTDHKLASSRISCCCRTSGPLCWSKRGARPLAYDFEQCGDPYCQVSPKTRSQFSSMIFRIVTSPKP
jgi:hypothetical protein